MSDTQKYSSCNGRERIENIVRIYIEKVLMIVKNPKSEF